MTALTDVELAAVHLAARQLQPVDRDAFLAIVTGELTGRGLRQARGKIDSGWPRLRIRACLQLGGLRTRTDQNQTRNAVL